MEKKSLNNIGPRHQCYETFFFVINAPGTKHTFTALSNICEWDQEPTPGWTFLPVYASQGQTH